MAQAVDSRQRRPGVTPTVVHRVIASVMVTAALSACLATYLLTGSAGAGEFRAAALAAALTALTCFVGAVVVVLGTHRLTTGLWGYVPGLLAVLGAGLWLSEAALSQDSDGSGSWWIGSVVALNPLFWVPIYAGAVLALRRLH